MTDPVPGNVPNEHYLNDLDHDALLIEAKRIFRSVHSPTIQDFLAGIRTERAHQVERWGASHDAEKSPFDWFWLLCWVR